jgi:hypothetical protein
VAEDLVDPTTGKSPAIGDPNDVDVAVAEEVVPAEDPGQSPSGADDVVWWALLGSYVRPLERRGSVQRIPVNPRRLSG